MNYYGMFSTVTQSIQRTVSMVETCITALQDVNLMIQDVSLMTWTRGAENIKGFYMSGFLI